MATAKKNGLGKGLDSLISDKVNKPSAKKDGVKDEKVVVKEEVKVEVEEDKKPNENKKQRHKQNNQQQGGDK